MSRVIVSGDKHTGYVVRNMADSSLEKSYTADMQKAREALRQFLGVDDLDTPVWITTKGEDIEQFRFDVRCHTYGTLLIVNPQTEIEPKPDIYVLAKSQGYNLDASLIGWQFASIVRREPIMHGGFPGNSGHTIPRSRLREMHELSTRLVGIV